MDTIRGLIIRSQSGFYDVQTEHEKLVCRMRGRLKKGPRLGDVAAIGDWVQVSLLGESKGMIEAIEPRQRMLVRMAPTPRGVYQQIIIANPDQAVFVFGCAHPAPRFGMLDRFLVVSEKQAIPALIVANKTDLVSRELAQSLFEHYTTARLPGHLYQRDQRAGDTRSVRSAGPEDLRIRGSLRGGKVQLIEPVDSQGWT